MDGVELNPVNVARILKNAGEKPGIPISPEIFIDHFRYMADIFAEVYDMQMTPSRRTSIVHACLDTYADFRENVLIDQGHILENHAVNKFMMWPYPCAYNGNFVLNGRIFVISCKLTEFALAIMATKHHGKMTEDEILENIMHVSDKFDHDQRTMRKLEELMEKETLTPTEFAAKVLCC